MTIAHKLNKPIDSRAVYEGKGIKTPLYFFYQIKSH
jgi:hypothetical protein